MSLSYAVIGTGAIGGYYGGRLAQSGCDVHFLLRSDCEHVKAKGLVVDSVDGDFTLPAVQAYSSAADIPPVDVALICLKTTHNSQLPALLPPLKPNGAILILQNGLGVEADVEAAIEQHLQKRLQKSLSETALIPTKLEAIPTIFGGLCFICAGKVGPGRIEHIDYGRLLIGEHITASEQFAPAPLLKAIAVDFNRAKIATDITNDLVMARWLKLVWNVPYNGLSVVLNATTEEMMRDNNVRKLIVTLMREVVVIANAWGQQNSKNGERALSDDVVEQMLESTETMPPYRTSMKLDYEQKRSLEIEAILGAPLQVAKTVGVLAPAMTMLYQQLTFLNTRNAQ